MSRLRSAAPALTLASALGLLAAAPTAQTFHDDVESANVQSIQQTGPGAYDIGLTPDEGASGKRQWFHFAVSDAGGETLTFRILDLSIEAPWLNGMTPTVSADPSDEQSWSRIDPNDTSYDAQGRDLTFSFSFPDDAAYHFAYSFVYPVSRADALVDDLAQLPFVTSRVLTQSIQGRDIELLEITEGNADDKLGIWIQARQHPAECGSSWTCEGFLEWLTGPTAEAGALRHNAVVRVVPMMNPDGVAMGQYRKNALGHDLNHIWDDADHQSVPSVAAVQDELLAFEQDVGVDVFLDLHTHSSELKNWVFGVDGDAQFDALERGFAQTLEDVEPDFSYAESSWWGLDPAVAKNHMHGLLPDMLAYTHEQTIHTIPYGPNAGLPITVARYERMGEALGEALVEFWDLPVKPWLYQDLDIALPGSFGTPAIVGGGVLAPGAPSTLELHGARPDAPSWLVVGFGELREPFLGGVLVPDPAAPGFIAPLRTDAVGGALHTAWWPSGVPVGTKLYAQWWIADPAGPQGFASTGSAVGLSDVGTTGDGDDDATSGDGTTGGDTGDPTTGG